MQGKMDSGLPSDTAADAAEIGRRRERHAAQARAHATTLDELCRSARTPREALDA